ncbi:MAG: peptidoglycan editing factor PgeF [Alphaproteobacteria bacterium]|nr:MAG: peptidoglycan editing factor PgeF [Alphaproteobacteria bacterium]
MKQKSDVLTGPVQHGFFTRAGGVSSGIYAGLNCGLGSDDNQDLVIENRRRVAASLGVPLAHLVTPFQIHSPDVVIMDAIVGTDDRPHADALVTQVPGLALGIVTADCVPVLLHDQSNSTVAALHAGWKGTLAGIVQNTIAAMQSLANEQSIICAAIGPCIAQPSYEVGPEVLAAFTAEDNSWSSYFKPSDRPDHYRFDLGGAVTALLDRSGVASIDRINHDTYAREAQYYSYRRTTHRGESDCGRQLSAIVLEGDADP